jgi:hypothetical protein
MWDTYNRGSCWMKKGPVSKNDAYSTNDKNNICGIVFKKGNKKKYISFICVIEIIHPSLKISNNLRKSYNN